MSDSGKTSSGQMRRNCGLPELRKRLQRRYPDIQVRDTTWCWTAGPNGHPRQIATFRGKPEDLIAAGLVTRDQLDKLLYRKDDGRRARPTTEFGDHVYLSQTDAEENDTIELMSCIDTQDPEYDDGRTKRRIDGAKIRGEVRSMLKRFRVKS